MRLDNKRFLMSGAPHIRAEENTRSIMADVIIALIFPLIMAVYFFGWRALTLTAMSVLSCVFFERLYTRIAKKEKTGGDLSAIVTGMILALTLPVATPLWIPIIGGAFAIIVVKQLYGGLGKNFLNPALTARVFLLSFPSLVTLYTKPSLPAGSLPLFADISTETLSPELIASITPLGKMKLGILPGIAMGSGDVVWGLRDVVVGNVAGAIGEVSAVVIAAAAIYLLVQFGLSISHYIMQQRITQAKHLLRFSDHTIEQIASLCGMEDANYFSRVFRKVEGVSPGEYRRQW